MENYEYHNRKKAEDYFGFQEEIKSMKSGVACPKCSTELEYDAMLMLACIPPKYNAWCPNCDFTGYV